MVKNILDQNTNEAVELRREYHTPWMAVIIPLMQAGVSGLLLCSSILALWTLAENPISKLTLGFTVLTVAMTITWINLILRWSRFVWEVEDVTGKDLNQDGRIGASETIKLEIHHKPSDRIQFMNLPMNKAQMQKLFIGLQQGLPFSENVWSGGGKPFTRDEFRGVRDVMVAKGWVRYRDERARNLGLELTQEGKSIIWSAVASFEKDSILPALQLYQR